MIIHEYKGFHICRIDSNLYEVYEESKFFKQGEPTWFLLFKTSSLDNAKLKIDNYVNKINRKWYQKIVDFLKSK